MSNCEVVRGEVIDVVKIEGKQRNVRAISPCTNPSCLGYQQRRNALIPLALAEVGVPAGAEANSVTLNPSPFRRFLKVMDRMWEETE